MATPSATVLSTNLAGIALRNPVLLAAGERAELATDEYLPLTSVLEGVVLLKKNPDHVPSALDEGKKTKKPGGKDDPISPSQIGRITKPLSHW